MPLSDLSDYFYSVLGRLKKFIFFSNGFEDITTLRSPYDIESAPYGVRRRVFVESSDSSEEDEEEEEDADGSHSEAVSDSGSGSDEEENDDEREDKASNGNSTDCTGGDRPAGAGDSSGGGDVSTGAKEEDEMDEIDLNATSEHSEESFQRDEYRDEVITMDADDEEEEESDSDDVSSLDLEQPKRTANWHHHHQAGTFWCKVNSGFRKLLGRSPTCSPQRARNYSSLSV